MAPRQDDRAKRAHGKSAVRTARSCPKPAGHECFHCKQWIPKGEPHDCWTTTEAALTSDLSEDLREAWERLRANVVRVVHRDEVEPPFTDWLREAYDFSDAAANARIQKPKSAARKKKTSARKRR